MAGTLSRYSVRTLPVFPIRFVLLTRKGRILPSMCGQRCPCKSVSTASRRVPKRGTVLIMHTRISALAWDEGERAALRYAAGSPNRVCGDGEGYRERKLPKRDQRTRFERFFPEQCHATIITKIYITPSNEPMASQTWHSPAAAASGNRPRGKTSVLG